nr:hypothetical protein [Pandoravirus massiliensis]
MKRAPSSPVPSERGPARRRIGRCDDRDTAIVSLLAAWARALGGTGSEEDIAAWQRFVVLTPSDPTAAYTLAESSGVPVNAIVASIYEPAWARVAALPTVASWLQEAEPASATPCLPSFMDLIGAAERSVAGDSRASLSRIVDDLASPDAGVRSQAAADLVTFLDVSLRRRGILGALGQGSVAPDYPPAVPPLTWAASAEALGTEPAGCDPRRAYYIMRARVGPHPEGATDGLPQEGAYTFLLGPFGDRRAPHVRGVFVPQALPAQVHGYDGWDVDPDLPLLRDVVEGFLIALVQTPLNVPYRTENLAGVSQVRNALVPLYDLNDLPDRVAETFYNQVGAGEDWWAAPVYDLAGVWIGECELVVAARVFAGQVEARRHASLFASRPPALFDVVTDAIARGIAAGATGGGPTMSMAAGFVPRETVERMLPRLWYRACSADPDPFSGTLRGAAPLAEAAGALGIPIDAATSARPELLCATLAEGAIQAQIRERYRDFVPPALEEGAPLWPGLDEIGTGDDNVRGPGADNPFVFS